MTGITKHFPGVQALSNVDFEIYPGEILGFLGENGAGKSTLIKILSGIHAQDQGTIWLNGQEIHPRSPHDAQNLGISTIHQELALAPNLTVAENIFLNREPRLALGRVDFARMNRAAEELLHDLGTDIPGNKRISHLTVAAQQMVEIAKAVSHSANLILMDEPTSALSAREVDALFALMRRLKERGVGVVFISHRLDEVRQIVDRVIVMRDGQRVGSLPIAEASEEQIIRMMVGRNVTVAAKADAAVGEPVLEVQNLSGYNGVEQVDLTVRKGEIVGISGLVGAGRTELVRLICGVDRLRTGEVRIDGKPVKIQSPADAVAHGIGWVPEDRKLHGLILGMSVQENSSMAILPRLSNWLAMIRPQKERAIAEHYVKALDIVTPSVSQTVRNLSGGNQQKVVLAKWLSSTPQLLIVDEPTRGIDVGAKSEIHRLLAELAQQGIAILMISSELPEILAMSDRIVVMCQGRVTGEFTHASATEEKILTAATQFLTIANSPN
ncbi:MAG: sugar ABC transporter ATP-binding protein [Caldilineaceae bacterium]|nr:sugar ABC transporter ATP-binding protein [Caldilineaceae bacterium]